MTLQFTYVDHVNTNLMCCICHMPFVDPWSATTCSHTFCKDCIFHSLSISLQCPIDRSRLTRDDLSPANPVIRHLVDELMVECPTRSAGCSYFGQRQLLPYHLRDRCQYQEVPCINPECKLLLRRRDMDFHLKSCGTSEASVCEFCRQVFPPADFEEHSLICSSQCIRCPHCSENIFRSDQKGHEQECSDLSVPCPYASRGCSWLGPRKSLQSDHIPSCPYNAMKGFLSIYDNHSATSQAESELLHHKLAVLEGELEMTRTELHKARIALGPWYKSLNRRSQPTSSPSRENINQPEASSSRASHSPSADVGESPSSPPVPDDYVAHFFSSPEPTTPVSAQPRPMSDFYAMHRNPSQHIVDHSVPGNHPQQYSTAVAPLDLSGNVETALVGLHGSVASLGSALDSISRRSDVALFSEKMRVNEDIGSLRAAVHGLRMQVHGMMMDRNAAVIGRTGEQEPQPNHGQFAVYHSPFTKL